MDPSQPFEQSRTNPFLRGYFAPTFDELDAAQLPVTGELPRALSGVYLRNGPNPQFEPPGRYHIFDGDGMLHAVYLDNGEAAYRNRWIESAGLAYEREQGRGVFYGMGEFKLPAPEVMAKYGPAKNLANTHVVRHGDKLLALYEGAPPTQVDLELGTLGVERFGGKLRGPFTAHPRFDPENGCMYGFGANPMGPYLTYYKVDPQGQLAVAETIDLEVPVMMHDFVITERYAVIFDSPAVYDLQAAMMGTGDPVQWKPERGTRIGVFPREGGTDRIRWFSIPTCYVFHFLNAYEDGQRIVIEGSPAPELRDNTGAGSDAAGPPTYLTRWSVDLERGTVDVERLTDHCVEMANIDLRRSGRRHRYGYFVSFDGENRVENWDSVLRYDRQTGESQRYVFGDGQITSEAVYVANPDSAAEEDGWVMSYVYDPARGATDLVGLPAGNIMAGPQFRVHLPQRVPAGFHGSWVAQP